MKFLWEKLLKKSTHPLTLFSILHLHHAMHKYYFSKGSPHLFPHNLFTFDHDSLNHFTITLVYFLKFCACPCLMGPSKINRKNIVHCFWHESCIHLLWHNSCITSHHVNFSHHVIFTWIDSLSLQATMQSSKIVLH